ncbi:rho guanine nucleotide exchange factor 16 isoform X2 [Eurytemora carolleeae]|uniref:rho guanine nucleotide exchange factor 16 isoform X2 n=1 Tax=Eurytemora carolleeae TaxID=1294199 RepID=UPI000C7921F5|nr:rho guanine nucleotide exchange factor 16 isoform X2 [Eurytemora carolleeae]|eukprot:XP_023342542.1 rho guanine nucleotide exchange factor 16-like isoform X2 [Eurytemora affinis]
MLPMQRVTRLPLLVSALQGRLSSTEQEYHTARECIEVLNCLVEECNEGARSVYRMEELICISKLLDFRELRAIALISSSRYLVKQGEVSRIQWKESTESVRLTFGKRNSRQNLVFYLFSDLLVISKKKSDDKYAVIDYCNRNLVQISSLNREESPVPGLPENSFPVWITLLQNHEHRTQEMLLYFQRETDRRNWISLLSPSLPQINTWWR